MERLHFNHDYIVAPRELHRALLLLKSKNPTSKCKIITRENLFDAATFTVDEKAIYELITHFNFSYQTAKIYLNNLKFINTEFASPKLQKLKECFDYLLKQKMVTFDDTKFIYFGKSALIVNYSTFDRELTTSLDLLGLKACYFRSNISDKQSSYRVFNDVSKEIVFVLNQIAHLLAANVDAEDIYLLTPASDYEYDFKLWNKEFKLPINLFNRLALYTYPKVQAIFQNLVANKDNLKDYLPELFTLTFDNKEEVETLKILRKYPLNKLSGETYLQLIKDQLTHSKIEVVRYQGAINVINQLPVFLENKHVFILGFTRTNFPLSQLDNEFIFDFEKAHLGLNTSSINNECSDDLLTKMLMTPNHFHLSFADHMGGQKQIVSEIAKKLNMLKIADNNPSVFYNKTYLNSFYSELVDNFTKYNAFDENISQLEQLADTTKYKAYDNDFSGVDHYKSDSFLSLSFSSLDSYFSCAFRFYLERVLKLKKDRSRLSAEIGTLFHVLMEKSDFEEIDVKAFLDNYLPTLLLVDREKMIIRGMENAFVAGLKLKAELEEQMKMATAKAEMEIRYKVDEKTELKGRIDRLYQLKDNGLVLVDYKTGATKFNVLQLDYGKSLQLPLYALMISRDERFKSKYILGLLLQKLKQEGLIISDDEDVLYKHYKSIFKMSGIILKDLDAITNFDESLLNGRSHFVKALAYSAKNATFYKTAPVYSAEFFASIAAKAELKIVEAAEKIRNNHFPVNPLVIDGEDSCSFCPFSNVCYKKQQDYTYVKTKETKEEENEDETE